jgi:uncharacterized protein
LQAKRSNLVQNALGPRLLLRCTPMEDQQRETVAFLSDPGSYGRGISRVETIETHVSRVFLAGDRAYKLKRAVRYPYLDFSTVEQRRQACLSELTLNRRTAPELYLELRAIVRRPDGSLGFAAAGPALDWVVVMRRFDQDRLFDRLATAGKMTPALSDALADHIAEFHRSAEVRRDYGGAAAMAEIVAENRRCLEDATAAAGFDPAAIAAAGDRAAAALRGHSTLVDRRRASGKVRRVHGDLHLRNICLFEGRPVLFDCLEFSERLASIDVLYDLAFLLMDLEHRGLGSLANRVLNRYLDRSDEAGGLALMPLFLSLRAAIRAHVTAAASAQRAEEARAYLALALRFLDPMPPLLVAVGGLSGSGKSTLAAALAPELGARPGARILRSDVLRKRLFEVSPETKLPAEAYAPSVSRRVYAGLRRRAAAALAAGYAVVVDAVSLRPEERRAFAAVAARARVPFTGLWLSAPAAAMTARIAGRRRDASDATPEVLAMQLRHDPGPIDWVEIDAGAGPEDALAAARRALAAPAAG